MAGVWDVCGIIPLALCQDPSLLLLFATKLGISSGYRVQVEKSERLQMCKVSDEKTKPAQENQFSASKVSAE